TKAIASLSTSSTLAARFRNSSAPENHSGADSFQGVTFARTASIPASVMDRSCGAILAQFKYVTPAGISNRCLAGSIPGATIVGAGVIARAFIGSPPLCPQSLVCLYSKSLDMLPRSDDRHVRQQNRPSL